MVDFTATRVCAGDATFFEASYLPADDTVSIFRWELGNGQVVLTDTDTLSYTYASPGNYFVTLTIENQEQCERSVTYEVIVDDVPGADFAFTEALCDEPTYFTDLTDPGAGAYIVSWQWDFGDDSTSTDQNPVHTYPAVDSTYLVHLVVTNSHGCVDSISYTLTKGLCMEALFTTTGDNQCNNTEVCFVDSSYILGDGHVITRWEWDFGDGQQQTYVNYQDSICHSYDTWGAYQVTLQIEAVAEGQTYYATSTQTVIVSAVPQARMETQTPCVNTLTQFFDESFTNGVEITSWWWDFGDITTDEDTSSLQHPVYRYPAPGTYSVQLIVTNANGCQDTLTENVRVYSVPEAAFSATHACAGGLVEFMDESTEAEGEITQWRWSFGDGAQSGVQDPQYVYPAAGDYDVQLVITDENQCADTIVNALTVFEVPLSLFDLIDNYENIQGQVLLDNRSEDAVRYVWDFGNGDTSQQVSPVVRYEDNGTYLIQLIAWNDSDCPDTSYMEYEVLFQGLYVPTGFTPEDNNEALRTWKPVGMNLEEYHVVVVNERGNVMFESTRLDENGSPAEGWDGTTGGEDMPTGNYLWSISAKFKDGRVWNGNQVGDGNNKAYGYLLLIR
jgi:PKD repeat protein